MSKEIFESFACGRASAGGLPQRMVGASGQCVSCGGSAVVSNYDGEYCKDCMQLHLLEKMFVNLTAMQRPTSGAGQTPSRNDHQNHIGETNEMVDGRESSEGESGASARCSNDQAHPPPGAASVSGTETL